VIATVPPISSRMSDVLLRKVRRQWPFPWAFSQPFGKEKEEQSAISSQAGTSGLFMGSRTLKDTWPGIAQWIRDCSRQRR
jgi:hypothetical protein